MTNRLAKDYWLVGIQFFLFFLFLFPTNYHLEIPAFLQIPSLILAIVGLIIVLVALFNLDKALTAFPTPKNNSELITSGVYKCVRHPMYTGILLTVFSFAFYSESFSRLTISVLLMILFYFKTNYEEQKLLQKYPVYNAYKARTGRFVPRF
ncbi:methyltransferase family protein [Lacihabitans soyangensis]|uniref:Isoprenylcysteine carboxylmethyltransferase family protein n=1 Tax=Lacihabitans soyangensis TaxID=869394 RepID=A0AAE3KRX5_9BACT|nr:isoprenylcysteine carboxylmethyltransferase family protein [Lacihabitans soyangensis]MCP9762667.1 isoprenylcysteine carboxylmethyltransferase family protein [Lacihabitans soyangensis]